MFAEYIELDCAKDAFSDAIALVYKPDHCEDLLVAFVWRACKYEETYLVWQNSFTNVLRRTLQLCVELLVMT